MTNSTAHVVRRALDLAVKIGSTHGARNLVEVREFLEPEIAALAATRARHTHRLGVLMARYPLVDTVLETYVNALYAMPTVAIVPLLVLWFGFDTTAKVVIVFLFTIFSIVLNTYQGVKNVERNLLEVARSFCASERQLWGDVVLPSALPYILVGLRLAIGRGLVGMVIADFYTAISGIGCLIVQYANSFQTAKLFVPIVTLMPLGTVLTSLLRMLEERLTPWLSHNRTT